MIRSVYKYAKNKLGYTKDYIDKAAPVPEGWHRRQADAIADAPKAPAKRAPGRPKKKVI